MITAMDAAHALGISPAEADALLTDLAKTSSDQVSLELDDEGGIFFRFPSALATSWQGHNVRVDAGVAPTRVASMPNATARGEALDDLEGDVIPPARHPRP